MSPSSPPVRTPSGSLWRHALEGALSVVAALAMMATAGCLALLALDAGEVAPLTRLVPAMVSTAVGGGISFGSDSAAQSGDAAGGPLGGMSLSLGGETTFTPLMLTFLGTAVLALGFFRPLRRRARPTSPLLWSRCGGALVAAGGLLPVLAVLGRGTAHLPDSVTERLGKGGSGSGGSLGGPGGGGPGGMLGKLIGGEGLPAVHFETGPAVTLFLGLLWVCTVLGVGCVAARRTSLPRPLALGRLREKWHPVCSALTGSAAVLCCILLVLTVLAAATALTGREQAARAAGVLLLAGPNLLAVLLTSGLGASWQAEVQRQQGGGGMMGGGMMGGPGRGQGGGTGGDKSVALSGYPVAGVPLWLVGLVVLLGVLVLAGYRAASRTRARTLREDTEAPLGRHLELALRMCLMVSGATTLFCLLARGSVHLGISIMGNEMGGFTAGLQGVAGVGALTAAILGGAAGYCGSRLYALRAARRAARGAAPRRREARPVRTDSRTLDAGPGSSSPPARKAPSEPAV
ncbi:streptophobe family protein [Streptomyces smyrnaeus]|uniref:streptophobe family protein n=1 Tax=Streptomyces smyrnaeus TaxID=1387713 RepID=UPI003690B48D